MTALLVITSYLAHSNSRCKSPPIRAKKNYSELILELIWKRVRASLAGTVADVALR